MRTVKDTLRKGRGREEEGRLINRRPSFSQDVYAEGRWEGKGGIVISGWKQNGWRAGEKDLVRGPVEIKLANGAIFYGGPLKS